MFSYNRLFEVAKEQKLESLELYISENKNFSFSLFHGEIDSYNISDSKSIEARGIFEGKIGYASTEKTDDTTANYLVDHIKQNALLTNSTDKNSIFRGSDKYQRKNVYNKSLASTTPEEKIALAKKLYDSIKAESELIQEIELSYNESADTTTLMNSYGLKLSSKTNYAVIFANTVATDYSGETKSAFSFKLVTDISDFDIKAFSKKVVKDTLDQFGSGPCQSGKYRCVFSGNAFSSLLAPFLQNLSSEQVQKNTSLLAGKLDQKVASSKLTVFEKPLEKNPFFRYFDDEGVATQNKTLIKSGVLKTYLYNLKTAAKDSTESTGNGYKHDGGPIEIGLTNVIVKPGSLSEDDLFAKAKEGVYITSVSGLHAGMNAQSGNFSLISQGFMIRDGKLAEPLSLITVAGNLFDVFNNIQAVGNNNELRMNMYTVPSVLVKTISVSGT